MHRLAFSSRFQPGDLVRILLVMLLLAFSLLDFAHAGRDGRNQWREASIQVDGVTRWYRVFLPASLTERPALVMLLHGGTSSMREVVEKGGSRQWPHLASKHGFLLVVPNGVNHKTGDAYGDDQHWNDHRQHGNPVDTKMDDAAFLEALVLHIEKEYGTDPARRHLTGSSNGGMMTYAMLIERPGFFRSAAAVIANLPVESRNRPKPREETPLLILVGDKDPLMPFEGGVVARRHGHVLSAQATVDWWVTANQAKRMPETVTLPDAGLDDDCTIILKRHAAGSGGAPVHFYTMHGGGHSMPSKRFFIPDNLLVEKVFGPQCKDMEGADVIWEFFASH